MKLAVALFAFLSPLFVTSHGSLPSVRSSFYLWRILLKFRDTLNFSTGIVFVIISARFFFELIFIILITLFIIYDPLTYLVKSHINVLRPLVIPVIFSEMYRTLTVAVELN